MTLQQEYDRLYHLLTKESKRRRSLFVKDMWRTNEQQDLIEEFVKYLENLDNDYFHIIYVDREEGLLRYHIKQNKRDRGTTIDFDVPFSMFFNNFKSLFLESFNKWFDYSWSARVMGKSRNTVDQYINNYFNTIKKDKAWLLFTYSTTINDKVYRCRNRREAYTHRLKKIKMYYESLMGEWIYKNPGRGWLQSETYKGLYKQFDMNFIFRQITIFVK